MSATEPDALDDGEDLTAAEYVLGVLDAHARAAAARRISAEPPFAAEVAAWEKRLTALVHGVDPVAPPARLWPAVAGRLRGGNVVAFRPNRIWNSIAVWRGVAGVAGTLAAACVILLVLSRLPEQAKPGPVAVARLAAPSGGVTFVATLDETRRRLIVTPVSAPAPTNRSAELWLIPAKAKPVPLGLFVGRRSLALSLPADVADKALLAVSLKPSGGSPTGQPTGPVIAEGALARL